MLCTVYVPFGTDSVFQKTSQPSRDGVARVVIVLPPPTIEISTLRRPVASKAPRSEHFVTPQPSSVGREGDLRRRRQRGQRRCDETTA